MQRGEIVYPNFPTEVLIVVAIVLFILAFLVVPFFFGKCFVIRKLNMVDARDANDLVSNTSSLSKVEVKGNQLILTRAGNAGLVRLEISAKCGGKFKTNKKVIVNFGKEESVSIAFKNDIESLYLVEPAKKNKERKNIFLSDLISSIIIAFAQLVAVSGSIVLTVYCFEGFNIPYTTLYHANYNYSYLAALFGLAVGIVSFIFNNKRMKLDQAPFNIKNIFKGRKEGK